MPRIARQTLLARFRAGHDRKLLRLPLHVNDEAFAEALVVAWHEVARTAASTQREAAP